MNDSKQLVVLIVDDNNLISMMAADMLDELGHKTIEAESGAEALKILALNPQIGLLFTDQQMPQMTGLELANQAKLLRPGLPIMIVSGWGDLPTSAQGRFPVLAKPYTQGQLLEMIKQVTAISQ